jgi:2'-5' RNA ligase
MIKKWNQFIKENNQYDFGCVMLDVPIKNWEKITNTIDKNDIYNSEGYGLERKPHLTILYGLSEDITLEDVKSKLDKFGPIEVKIDNIGFFDTNEEFDVVKFDVIKTDQLEEMFQSLSTLPNKNEFPNYKPHITISYLKKGCGKKYSRKINKNLGRLEKIIFSKPNGEIKSFKLKNRSSVVD